MRIDRRIDISFRTQQFVLVAARMGSFHRAAKLLRVDHSVIVRTINRLERDLGIKLFDRNRSRFVVTSAGVIFVKQITEAVEYVERACNLARYHAQVERGALRIGYSSYVHSRLVPILERWSLSTSQAGIGGQMGEGYSETTATSRLELTSGPTGQLIEFVSQGRLHAGFGIQPIGEEELIVHPIARETFCLAISKNHRFANHTSIYAKDLDGETVFFLPRTSHPAFHDQTIEYIGSTGAKPVLRDVLSLTHALEIVAHNFGVALLPRSASHVSHIGVLFKPIADKLLSIETAFFRRFDQQDDRLPVFIDQLLSHIKTSSLNR